MRDRFCAYYFSVSSYERGIAMSTVLRAREARGGRWNGIVCPVIAENIREASTHFELRPEAGGPLPGIVVVCRTRAAAGVALCVQP